MTSKPDVFVVIPPPLYMDGWVKDSQELYNQHVSKEIPKLAKECGAADDQIIDLFTAMGGAELKYPHYYCDHRWCDGFHPVDAGQDVMGKEILKTILNFYMKNPLGKKGLPQ